MRISEIFCWATVAMIPVILVIGIIGFILVVKGRMKDEEIFCAVINISTVLIFVLGFISIILAVTGN